MAQPTQEQRRRVRELVASGLSIDEAAQRVAGGEGPEAGIRNFQIEEAKQPVQLPANAPFATMGEFGVLRNASPAIQKAAFERDVASHDLGDPETLRQNRAPIGAMLASMGTGTPGVLAARAAAGGAIGEATDPSSTLGEIGTAGAVEFLKTYLPTKVFQRVQKFLSPELQDYLAETSMKVNSAAAKERLGLSEAQTKALLARVARENNVPISGRGADIADLRVQARTGAAQDIVDQAEQVGGRVRVRPAVEAVDEARTRFGPASQGDPRADLQSITTYEQGLRQNPVLSDSAETLTARSTFRGAPSQGVFRQGRALKQDIPIADAHTMKQSENALLSKKFRGEQPTARTAAELEFTGGLRRGVEESADTVLAGPVRGGTPGQRGGEALHQLNQESRDLILLREAMENMNSRNANRNPIPLEDVISIGANRPAMFAASRFNKGTGMLSNNIQRFNQMAGQLGGSALPRSATGATDMMTRAGGTTAGALLRSDNLLRLAMMAMMKDDPQREPVDEDPVASPRP